MCMWKNAYYYLLKRSGDALNEVLVEWLEAVDRGDPCGLADPRPLCILKVNLLSSNRLPIPLPKTNSFIIRSRSLLVGETLSQPTGLWGGVRGGRTFLLLRSSSQQYLLDFPLTKALKNIAPNHGFNVNDMIKYVCVRSV
jgi:hypothetical protein